MTATTEMAKDILEWLRHRDNCRSSRYGPDCDCDCGLKDLLLKTGDWDRWLQYQRMNSKP